MKKTLITIIVIAAIGAIGYGGYEYANANAKSNPPAPTVTNTSQPNVTSTSATPTSETNKTSDSQTKTTNTTTTNNSKNSATKDSNSTVAPFVPTKVINYVAKDNDTATTNSSTSKVATTSNSNATPQKAVQSSNTATKPEVNTNITNNSSLNKNKNSSTSESENENSSTTKKENSKSPASQNTNSTTPSSSSSKTNNTTSSDNNASSSSTTTAPPKEVAPIISASDIFIPQGSSFNWGLIKVTTNQPNTRILFSGTVNTSKSGKYPVLIQAINTDGLKSEKTINVIVQQGNTPSVPAPVIVGSNIIIGQGGLYTPNMLDVHATVNGKSVPVTYSGAVDNNKPGIYTVTATATNSQGVSTSKEFTVQVVHVK